MTPTSTPIKISEEVLSNGAYKFVAFVASVILWLTILGRKDAVIVKDIKVNFIVKENIILNHDTDLKIVVKARGKRRLVKLFNEKESPATISLKDRPVGVYSIPLNSGSLQLPSGLRLISVKPSTIRVELENRK